jgi:hypothetical protein
MSLLRIRPLVLFAVVVASLAGPRGGAAQAQSPEPILCPPGPDAVSQSVRSELPALPFRLALPGLAFEPQLPLAEAPPSADLLELQERLARRIETTQQEGHFAVAVTDLQTGGTVGAGLDRQQQSGCIVNLFAIVAALRDVDAGRYPLSDVDATIRQTIWASDASTAHQLFARVGGGDPVEGVRRVRLVMQNQLLMSSSSLDHPPAFPEETVSSGLPNLVTARDMNRALALIYAGRVLSPQLTAYLLEAMTDVKPGLNYLTGILGWPAVVSHKNGFFPDPEGWVDNDTAIVRFGPNLEYAFAITFMSEGVPVKYADIPLGQALVHEAWAYFEAAY